MGVIVNHNISALNAANTLTQTYNRLARSVNRLSSGLRINSARDDAAGLAIRELMRSDIRVMNQGVRNANDAINMLMTADGAMGVIDEKLIRMKELAEQAATGTYTTAQREIMNKEFQAMADEVTRIANATEFNGTKLLDGSMSALHPDASGDAQGIKIHFGTGNNSAEDYYFVNLGDVRWQALQGDAPNRLDNNHSTFTTTNTALNATSGYFSFYYNHDGGTVSTAVNDIFAIFSVTSATTLSDVNDAINRGTDARGTLDLDSSVTAGQYIAIGSVVFEFVNGAAATFTSAVAVDLSAATATAASAATALMSAINNTSYSPVYAIQSSGDASNGVLNFFARNGGTSGNSIDLRVGGVTTSATFGTWTTSGTSATVVVAGVDYAIMAQAMNQASAGSAFASYGAWGFYYNIDGDGTASEVTDLFGVMSMASADSLSEIVTRINQGTAARTMLSIGSNVSTGVILSIGNMVIEIVSGLGAASMAFDSTVYSYGDSHYIQISNDGTMYASTFMEELVSVVNATSTANFWVVSGTAAAYSANVYIFARDFGSGGNAITVNMDSAVAITNNVFTVSSVNINDSSQALSGGGITTWATASAVYNARSTGYTLRLTAGAAHRSFDYLSVALLDSTMPPDYFSALDQGAGTKFASALSTSVDNFEDGGLSWITAQLYQSTNGSATTYQLRITGANADASNYHMTVATMSTGVFASFGATTYFDDDDSGDSFTANWAAGTNDTNILTQSRAQSALAILDAAIQRKDTARAEAGSKANRLANTVTALTIQSENLQASESAISDADIALEMTEFTRNLILAQSGVAMLAQANSVSNLALQLLGG